MIQLPLYGARGFGVLAQGQVVWKDRFGLEYMDASTASLPPATARYLEQDHGVEGAQVWLFRMPPKQQVPPDAPGRTADPDQYQGAPWPGGPASDEGGDINLRLLRPEQTLVFRVLHMLHNSSSVNNSTGGFVILEPL